jgi:hypothetical protein
MTTPALQAAVQRAYQVFSARKAPAGPLNVCTYCCMPAELEREMRSLPLRKISTRHFYGYCNAAMNDLVQPADEIHYLLPRWLELLAAGQETHISPELALDRAGRCAPGSFDEEQSRVLDEFMLAYFDHHLSGGGFWGWSADPLAMLIMADAGGRAVQPLLEHWQEHQHPVSTALFVRSTYWDFWPKSRLSSAFAEDRPTLQATFKSWILAPSTQAAFIEKLHHPEFIAQVDQVPAQGSIPFSLMVDAVLDNLWHN